jgi:hypothetical protein
MFVKTVSLHIKRDAMTTIPVDVPAHEVSILRNIHGKENLYPQDGENVIEIAVGEEFQRLCNKYGFDAVAAVYGEAGEDKVAEACEKIEVDASDSSEVPKRGRPKADKAE